MAALGQTEAISPSTLTRPEREVQPTPIQVDLESEKLTPRFKVYVAQRNLASARLACWLVASLMPVGIMLDMVVYETTRFTGLRLAASAITLVVLSLTRLRAATRFSFVIGALPAFIAAGAIQVIILRLDGYSSPYYGGLNLCILGIGLVFMWRAYETAIVCGVILLMWLLPGALMGQAWGGPLFFNNLYFLVLTSVIAVASNALRYTLARREFAASAKLAVAQERLETAYRHQKEFMRTVTHELRSPLHSILGFAELIAERETQLSERSRGHLARIENSAQRLLGVINDILDLSKIEAGILDIAPRPLQVKVILDDVAEAARVLIGTRAIELQVSAEPDIHLFSDEQRVRQVLINLVSNAVKFTESGYIRLQAARIGDRVELTVEDSGVGIDPAAQRGIFVPFQRTGSAARKEGTGLGLSIVRRLVELLGGEVVLLSEKGSGTTVRVTLPNLSPARQP